jgi:hypothetical protein
LGLLLRRIHLTIHWMLIHIFWIKHEVGCWIW